MPYDQLFKPFIVYFQNSEVGQISKIICFTFLDRAFSSILIFMLECAPFFDSSDNIMQTDFSESHYNQQLEDKIYYLTQLLKPFFQGEIKVHRSALKHYRMRAEFRVWHDGDDLYHIMFDPQSKRRYRIDQFPIASTLINATMSALLPLLKQQPILRNQLFQIDYLSTVSNKIIVSLLYHKKLDETWIAAAKQLKQQLEQQQLMYKLSGVPINRKFAWIRILLMKCCQSTAKIISIAKLKTVLPNRMPALTAK